MRERRAENGSGPGAAVEPPGAAAPVSVCRLAIEPAGDSAAQAAAAVVFVPGGVLFDDTLWRRWLLGLLNRLGLRLEYHRFCESLERDYLTKSYCGLCSCDQAIGSFLRRLGLSRGQVDEITTAGRSRREYFEATLRPLPGALATLEQLAAANLSLAVLADSPLSGVALQQKLSRLGLGQYFDVVVSSCDLRTTLPESTNYRAVCAALEVPADQVVLVGSRSRDLAAATQFGMRTIACNNDADAQADQFAANLRQVADLIGPFTVSRHEVPRDRAAA